MAAAAETKTGQDQRNAAAQDGIPGRGVRHDIIHH